MQTRNKIITVVLLVALSWMAGCNTMNRNEDNARVILPLFEYRKFDSYYRFKNIDPAGYFAVGLRYVHPPRVEWVPLEEAVSYDLVLIQGDKVLGVTPAQHSPAFATEGWGNGKTGKAGIVIIGYDADGKRVAQSRMFPFYIVPGFEDCQTVDKERPYDEAAWAVFDRLRAFDRYEDYWKIPEDHPARKIPPVFLGCAITANNMICDVVFPALHDWIWVDMCESLLQITDDPERIEQVKSFMRSAGDHLLLCRLEGEGYLYAGMVRCACDAMGGPGRTSYNSDPTLVDKYKRLIEPSKNGYAAEALLKIYETLGDRKYYDAALRIAEIYVKTQLADGSWPARVDGKDGYILGQYSSSVISVVSFMDRLMKHDPNPRWKQVKEKALAWVKQYPCKTYGWVLNFDDCPAFSTLDNPYYGLSNWDLFCLIRYAGRRPQDFENAEKLIVEQLNWTDNHFVFYGDDPLLPFNPYYPTCGEQGNPASFISYGGCWVPMDYHTSNWGTALLAAYQLTGDRTLLEKAKATANAITKYQLDDGRTITWMQDRYFGGSSQYNGANNIDFWPSGWAAAANFWAQLHAMGLDK